MGKISLDQLCDRLEIERPFGINLALAKGILKVNGKIIEEFNDSNPKWTIPENVIKGDQYLLFKHLIISEIKQPLVDDELQPYLLYFIESGLRIMKEEMDALTSMEDYRLSILNQ